MVRMVLDHVLGTESSPIRNSEWGNLAGTFIRSSRQRSKTKSQRFRGSGNLMFDTSQNRTPWFYHLAACQICSSPQRRVRTAEVMHCLDTWKPYNSPPPKCKTSWLCSVFMMLGSVEDPYRSLPFKLHRHWAFKGMTAQI